MASFTAADVKSLRDRFGAGMLDSKNALVEADGDIDKAIEILRLKGQKGVAKREDRSTSEGLIAATVVADRATVVELASETDFVAKNEKFVTLGDRVLCAVASAGATTVSAGGEADLDGQTVTEAISDVAAILGEKIELRQVHTVTGERCAVYLHKTSKDLPPQIGVVVAYSGSDSETARSIAQHISFANPEYVTRDAVPAQLVDRERSIIEEISRNEGKPAGALPKIIEGRLNGFYKNIVLLEQDYARDNKLSVKKVLDDAGLTVTGFVRAKVGAEARS